MGLGDELNRSTAWLARRDPRLAAAVRRHGPPPVWSRPPGFRTLVLLVLEQQVSLASARATFDRLEDTAVGVEPERIAALDDGALRAAGVSRQKTRYLRALSTAVATGALDLDRLGEADDDEVRAELTALTGIGPWTADVYLLACLGRPDVWPVGDRALQVSAAEVLGLGRVPSPGELESTGEPWRPHRSTAARILWHSYLSRRGRSGPPA